MTGEFVIWSVVFRTERAGQILEPILGGSSFDPSGDDVGWELALADNKLSEYLQQGWGLQQGHAASWGWGAEDSYPVAFIPPISDTLRRFIDISGLDRERLLIGRLDLVVDLEAYLLPVFGSPPEVWDSLKSLNQHGPFFALAGYLGANDHPVLAGIAGVTGFVVWFATPSAEMLRLNLAERLRRRVDLSSAESAAIPGATSVDEPTEPPSKTLRG